MQHVNQALEKAVSTTRGSTGEQSGQDRTSEDARNRVAAFFARLVTVYGESRCRTLWRGDEDQFRMMRREWADQIGKLSWSDLEMVFRRLKKRLASGDSDYYWPDVGQVLRLAEEGEASKACHKVYRRPRLDEPEWRKKQKRTLGRLAAQTSIAVLDGRACFLEDKWHASC